MKRNKLLHSEILGIICILFIIIGCFLPWLIGTINGENIIEYGYDRDGKYVFIFSVIILGLLYLGYIKDKRMLSAIGMFLFNLLILFTLIMLMQAINDYMAQYSDVSELSLGVGPYLIGIGSLGLIIANFWQMAEGYKQKKSKNIQSSEEKIEEDDSIKILNIRYAKGEITKEEYEQMKKDIED